MRVSLYWWPVFDEYEYWWPVVHERIAPILVPTHTLKSLFHPITTTRPWVKDEVHFIICRWVISSGGLPLVKPASGDMFASVIILEQELAALKYCFLGQT